MENKADNDKRFNGDGRRYQIQNLWDIHHEVIRLAVLGMKHADIARELGITSVTVSTCLNSEVGRRHLATMRGARDAETLDLAVEIRRKAPVAFRLLQEYMENDDFDPKQRIAIAMDTMDRAGYGAPRIIEGRMVHAHLTADDLNEIKQRARENNMIVDTIVEEMAAEPSAQKTQSHSD